MIFKPLNMLGFVAAALAGLHLYTTKHEAALLDRELRAIARDIDAANERTQALSAEWAWLNEPERLRSVAQRHLSLEPMQPTQFLRLNEADRRMPAAVAYSGPPALFAAREPEVPPGATVTVALLPRLSPVVQVAHQVPVEPPAPAMPAEAAPAPLALALPEAPPRELALRPAEPVATPRPTEPQAAPRQAEPVAAPRQVEPPAALAARAVDPRGPLADIARASVAQPRPLPAPVAMAAAPRLAPRPAPVAATLPPIAAPRAATPVVTQVAAARPALPPIAPVAAPRPVPTQLAAAPRAVEPPAVSLGGSLLGGSRPLLAPPVPFGSANAATLNGGGAR